MAAVASKQGAPTHEELRRALRSEDRARRISALKVLEAGAARIDPQTCILLVELLAAPDKESRRRASGALTVAAHDPQLRFQIGAALHDGSAERRWGAAFALARADVLDEEVLAAAIDALAMQDGDVRWAAAEVVRRIVDAVPSLLSRVVDASSDANVVRRKMALYCLRDVGFTQATPFVSALDSPDAGVRIAALSGLVRAGRLEPATIERMLVCLDRDAEPGVRRAAAATLGRLAHDHRAVRASLEAIVRSSPDTDLVRAARWALGEGS